MSLKYEVDSLDGMDETQQGFYAKEGDKFRLKIEGLEIPDVSGLKAKVEELLGEAKTAKEKARDAEKKAAAEAKAAAEKSGDVEALNQSWQKKYDDDLKAAQTAREEAMQLLHREKVHSKAVELATTLAVPGSADVLLPHIESRLSMEIKDGRAVAIVKDATGKPSALTVEELGKEIANNAAFAPLIVASNAAGSGANGKQNGRAAQTKTATRADFEKWSPAQQKSFAIDGGTVTD